MSLIRSIKENPALLKLDHFMISFIFVHLVSAQLTLALSKNSAIYIFTKLSKEPVAHYENDHSDGLEKMRSLLIRNFERRKHPVTGF